MRRIKYVGMYCLAGAVALMLAVGLAMSAHAETVVSVGVTQFHAAPNGIWYQEAFDHKLNMTSPSFQIEYKNGPYSIGYLHAGRVSSYAKATASDANYDLQTNTCVGKCWPMSTWYGKGDVQGISLMYTKQYGNVFIEGGVLISRPTWTMTIPDWRGCETCEPRYLQVVHNPKLIPLPMFGIGYKFGDYKIKYKLIPTNATGDDWPAVYRGLSSAIFIDRSF